MLHVAYIDEKWFYKVIIRRTLKILPKGEEEEIGSDTYTKPKMLSRRFPVKTMIMGVVGRPIPHRNFDGRIHLERISKTKYLSTCTANRDFSHDIGVNEALKTGEWRSIISGNDRKIGDIAVILTEAYGLEEYVSDQLKF